MNKTDIRTAGARSVDKTCSEITMKDFLDFLRTAYQVNEAIEGVPADIKEKTQVNWRKLTNNALIAELQAKDLEINQPKSPNNTKSGTDGSTEKDKSVTSQDQDSSDKQDKSQTNSNDRGTKEPEKGKERRSSNTSVYINRRKGSLASKKDSSFESSRSFDSTHSSGPKTAEKYLKKKLNEVLQEGVLDSVLPYLLPKQPMTNHVAKRSANNMEGKRSNTIVNEKPEKPQETPLKEKKEHRRKSTSSSDGAKPKEKDVEVVIHVCDEIKNLRKDFRCSQKLLVSQMGYFGEVTTGQKLEDMDISVHCDITIFDWLIRWVKKEQTSEEHWPTLDPNIVVPVLMSSAFLQMDALQEHCLSYCRQYINEIIRDSANLACLNDSILTRLAGLFSNSEIENLKDRKDKLQSKLYCKLILSLADPKPDENRGHFSTLASLYRCSRCNKLIMKSHSVKINCLPSAMSMDRYGAVQSIHTRDPSWNLSDYVRDLKLELKTWRRVYWRLWSDCHLLFCSVCQGWLPPHQMGWCRFHTESPQFFTMENQRSMSFPIGRYPCCGERAYRFEVLKNQSGCQYKEHNPQLKSSRDQAVHKLWLDHKEFIRQEPPALVFPERLTRIVSSREDSGGKSPNKEPLWWDGLELVPLKPKQGLLTKIWDNFLKKEEQKRPSSDPNSKSIHPHRTPLKRHVSVPLPVQSDNSSNSDSSDQDSASSDGGNSEESCHATVRVTAKPRGQASASTFVQNPSTRLTPTNYKVHVKPEVSDFKLFEKIGLLGNDGSRFWVSKLSTRCNQDNQREFEERAVRQMESILAKKTSGESLSNSLRSTTSRCFTQNFPAGGSYIRLEAEWREAHCHSHGCPGSTSKPRLSYLTSSNSVTACKPKVRTQR